MDTIDFSEINNSILMAKNVIDGSLDSDLKKEYDIAHSLLNEPEIDLQEKALDEQLRWYGEVIKKYTFEELQEIKNKRLIVSLTSYPARIDKVYLVLETIYEQTRKADEVILWLAEEQFPNKEADLPGSLTGLIEKGQLIVRWCDDLKPHKKYFYALQEHSNDLVVTVDDDMLYPNHLLDNLWRSYLLYPNAVHATRAHLIVINEHGKILPYRDWIKTTDACILQPSMQLIATGCGGVLYPAWLFTRELLNKDAIMDTCLLADDLWLKAMQLYLDIPVVVAQKFDGMRYISGTQKEALCRMNLDNNQNDTYLCNILEWFDAHYHQGILIEKLISSEIGVKILGIEAVCMHFRSEREAFQNDLNKKLQKTYDEKVERGIRIRQLEKENEHLRNNLSKIQVSYSYRVGRLLTFIPRKIKAFLEHCC